MKNIPNKIYLNLNGEAGKAESFNDLCEVTWNIDKVFANDLCYKRSLKENENKFTLQELINILDEHKMKYGKTRGFIWLDPSTDEEFLIIKFKKGKNV